MSWPDTLRTGPYPPYPGADGADGADDLYPEYPGEDSEYQPVKRQTADVWMDQRSKIFPRYKRRSIALFLLRLPAFVPWIFIVRGWYSLNAKDVLTHT